MSKGKKLAQQAQEEIPSISCEEFEQLRESDENIVLLDVRMDSEWEEGHIDGAIHIPRGFLEFRVEEEIPDKDKRIVLCCASGPRSALAAVRLKELGYSNVAFLDGGYTGYCESKDDNQSES